MFIDNNNAELMQSFFELKLELERHMFQNGFFPKSEY